MFEDSQLAIRLNKAMVEKMKKSNVIYTKIVENAFLNVYRHWFIPDQSLVQIYSDKVIYTKVNKNYELLSSSTSPNIMAQMLEKLQLKVGEKILEIGTGTGYNAALIGNIVGEKGMVITIDIEEDVIRHATEKFSNINYSWVKAVEGDGFDGYENMGKYDKIMLTVGTWGISKKLLEQLKLSGEIILPLSIGCIQYLVRFVKVSDKKICGEIFGIAEFIRFRSVVADTRKDITLKSNISLVTQVEQSELLAELVSDLMTDSNYIECTIKSIFDISIEQVKGLLLWLQLCFNNSFYITAQHNELKKILPIFISKNYHKSLTLGFFEKYEICLIGFELGKGLTLRQYGTNQGLLEKIIKQINLWRENGEPEFTKIRLIIDFNMNQNIVCKVTSFYSIAM